MNAFPIGTSAMAAGQRALDVIGQNLANATTPGYHRQAINLTNRVTEGTIGVGVAVASITRYTASPVRAAIVTTNADVGSFTAQLDARRQIETALRSGEGGIGGRLESFFNQVEELTGRPDSLASRRAIIASASDLARQFNSAAGDIDRFRAELGRRIPTVVDEVNTFATRIASLNTRITIAEQNGAQANDLRDLRDQLINDLSQRVDVKTVDQPFGVINVISSGAPLVVGEYANRFQAAPDALGNLVVTQQGVAQPVTFRAGTLGALLQDYNTSIPATRTRLDTLAGELIRRVNQVQATGLGATGPITSAAGVIGASSAAVPLNAANLPFPVQAGQLTVSVTATATGNRTNTTIPINPATQSLQDIATALSGVPGLLASVDPASNTLQIQGQPGFAFDFAGRDSNPPGSGAVPNSDTAGLLAAIGVNGLFDGFNATNIGVRAAVVADPNLLAAARSGNPGDGTNLERLAAVRDQQAVANRTLAEDYADIAAAIGSEVQILDDRQTAVTNTMRNLAAQEQAITGVDRNEELLRLLDYQRLVEGASKYLSVVNRAMDEIFSIIR